MTKFPYSQRKFESRSSHHRRSQHPNAGVRNVRMSLSWFLLHQFADDPLWNLLASRTWLEGSADLRVSFSQAAGTPDLHATAKG